MRTPLKIILLWKIKIVTEPAKSVFVENLKWIIMKKIILLMTFLVTLCSLTTVTDEFPDYLRGTFTTQSKFCTMKGTNLTIDIEIITDKQFKPLNGKYHLTLDNTRWIWDDQWEYSTMYQDKQFRFLTKPKSNAILLQIKYRDIIYETTLNKIY